MSMDLLSGNSRFEQSNTSATGGHKLIHEHKRPAVRRTRLGAGTLACARCDAPIALGPEPVSVVAQLVCPYCRHSALVRDFLSLALPTRPAHVVVRVSYSPVESRRRLA
jgi:DNA-directed RNA polymerase subunit RPC12/RpoP